MTRCQRIRKALRHLGLALLPEDEGSPKRLWRDSPRYAIGLTMNDIRYYAKHRRWRGLGRVLWDRLHGYYSESCQECGRTYAVWHAPDYLWHKLVSKSGGGLLCHDCFDAKAERAGYVLVWVPSVWFRRDRPKTQRNQLERYHRAVKGAVR